MTHKSEREWRDAAHLFIGEVKSALYSLEAAAPKYPSAVIDGGELADLPSADILSRLASFHAAADTGSLTQAGKQLELSQSAVSRQISYLEDELGITLFNRHARGLTLTQQGAMLFEHVDRLLGELGKVLRTVKRA